MIKEKEKGMGTRRKRRDNKGGEILECKRRERKRGIRKKGERSEEGERSVRKKGR